MKPPANNLTTQLKRIYVNDGTTAVERSRCGGAAQLNRLAYDRKKVRTTWSPLVSASFEDVTHHYEFVMLDHGNSAGVVGHQCLALAFTPLPTQPSAAHPEVRFLKHMVEIRFGDQTGASEANLKSLEVGYSKAQAALLGRMILARQAASRETEIFFYLWLHTLHFGELPDCSHVLHKDGSVHSLADEIRAEGLGPNASEALDREDDHAALALFTERLAFPSAERDSWFRDLLWRAEILFRKKDFAAAILDAKRVAKFRHAPPRYARRAWVLAGKAYLALDDLVQAKACFQSALASADETMGEEQRENLLRLIANLEAAARRPATKIPKATWCEELGHHLGFRIGKWFG